MCVCRRRKRNRVAWKDYYELAFDRPWLAMDLVLYYNDHAYLAHYCFACQCSIWSIFFFYQVSCPDRSTDEDYKKFWTRNSELRTQNSQLPPAANIAIFASGTGSNASRIIEYFHQKHEAIATVKLIVCNKPGAGVVEVARENRVPTLLIDKEKFFRGNAYVDELKAAKIDFIVLAGFLWKIPQNLIYHYRNKIINIHPALLPKFGGKGMYGSRVHEAVINCGEHESGITIHYVDEHYDNGDVIFQKRVPVADNETPESLASKIHDLEHTHYPMIIEQLLLQPIGR